MRQKRCSKLQNTEQEFSDTDVKEYLNQYSIEYPDEKKITQTIELLRPYVPQKKGLFFYPFQQLARMAIRELSYVHPLFWCANIVLFLSGCGLLLMAGSDPYLIALSMAPVPFILGIIEIFKSFQQNMHELEMTTEHSLQEIILAKLIVVGMFNLLLNLLITLTFPMLLPAVFIWKLILYWLTPFTVIAAFTFWIANRLRNGTITAIIALAIWLGIVSGIANSHAVRLLLEKSQMFYGVPMILLSTALMIRQMFLLYKSPIRLNEKRSAK